MNARVRRVMAEPAQETADGDDDLVVVEVLKRPILEHGKRVGWIRRIIVDRPNKDLPRQPEAAAVRNEINEGIPSAPHQTI